MASGCGFGAIAFAQFYNPQEPTTLNDAFGRCVDTKAQQQDSQKGGSGGSTPRGSNN